MEQLNLLAQTLELMNHPSFVAQDGRIVLVNRAAASRMLAVGSLLEPMLESAGNVYQEFSSGTLYLTLSIQGTKVGASVSRIGVWDVFTLEPAAADQSLYPLALAARELRQPLHSVLAAVDQWIPTVQEDPTGSLAKINQGLHQILRLVTNMTNASTSTAPCLELRDVTSVLAELAERAESLCHAANIRLEFTNHPAAVYAMLDSDMLEQSFYHLLSNAIKRTQSGGTIAMEFSRQGNQMQLKITDPGNGPSHSNGGDIFHQYRREPVMEGNFYGIGLGMKLIQQTATAHGGTVLLEHLPTGGVCVTMTMAIQQKTEIRTPTLRVESASVRSAGLVQLSELLPTELYAPNRFDL